MLDIKWVRKNQEEAKEALAKRGFSDADIDEVLAADAARRAKIKESDDAKAELNKLSDAAKRLKGEEKQKIIDQASLIKNKHAAALDEARIAEDKYWRLAYRLPNIPLPDVPVGKDERDNVVLREVGQKPHFDFPSRDYMEIAAGLDIIDTERAAKVSGSRFGYLKNEAVLLEFALINLALKVGAKEGFTPIIPPVLIAEGATEGLGYWDDEKGRENYFLVKDTRCYQCRHYLGGLDGEAVFCYECGESRQQEITADGRMKCHNCGRESRLTWFYLVGTAEHAIVPMHQGEIFAKDELPKRYIGFSTAFRREAGTYGKDTKGIMRVHQFDKVELISFTDPMKSEQELHFLLSLEERLWQTLRIPYRIVQLCTGDIAKPAAATYDIEAWLPGQGKYREMSSASTTTDFQARRLKTKFHTGEGKCEHVHILNATGFAIGRTLIAILENYQQKDGSVRIPDVLQKYMGLDIIKKK